MSIVLAACQQDNWPQAVEVAAIAIAAAVAYVGYRMTGGDKQD